MRKMLVAAAAAFLVTACAGSSNMVLTPNTSGYTADNVMLENSLGTTEVEEGKNEKLDQYMAEAFFGEGGAFTKGGEQLTVKYGFIGFDEGSQAARYLLGGIGGGEARMVLVAEFYGPDGDMLAKIQSEGRLGGGFFGGDSDSAIKKAAKEIADYAESNFTD